MLSQPYQCRIGTGHRSKESHVAILQSFRSSICIFTFCIATGQFSSSRGGMGRFCSSRGGMGRSFNRWLLLCGCQRSQVTSIRISQRQPSCNGCLFIHWNPNRLHHTSKGHEHSGVSWCSLRSQVDSCLPTQASMHIFTLWSEGFFPLLDLTVTAGSKHSIHFQQELGRQSSCAGWRKAPCWLRCPVVTIVVGSACNIWDFYPILRVRFHIQRGRSRRSQRS